MKQRNSIYAVGEDGQDEQERQSDSLVPPNKKDLPVFLRTVVTVSAKVTYKQSMVLLYLVSQVQGFFVWYQITQSLVAGATLAQRWHALAALAVTIVALVVRLGATGDLDQIWQVLVLVAVLAAPDQRWRALVVVVVVVVVQQLEVVR